MISKMVRVEMRTGMGAERVIRAVKGDLGGKGGLGGRKNSSAGRDRPTDIPSYGVASSQLPSF